MIRRQWYKQHEGRPGLAAESSGICPHGERSVHGEESVTIRRSSLGLLARWLKFSVQGMIARSRSGNCSLPIKTITEPAREIPLYGEYEVAVLGGGPAGIAAAVAAARAGRR